MFGRKEDTVGAITFGPSQVPAVVQVPERQRFVEFEGAMAEVDDETGKLDFVPRGAIRINVNMIGGFYDHTILLFGNKIRVMETYEQIREKIGEAER